MATKEIGVLDLPHPTSKRRLETLSDGIFAVAMTILVLDLKVPALEHSASSAELTSILLGLWPKLAAFIISFLFLARNWYIHNLIFHSLERVDYPFSYVNILLLMAMCCLPFSTSLISEHPHARVAAVVYVGNMILAPGLFFLMWHHATYKRSLVKKDLNPALVAWFKKRHVLIISMYALAFPISYFSSELSIFWIFCYQTVTALTPLFRKAKRL